MALTIVLEFKRFLDMPFPMRLRAKPHPVDACGQPAPLFGVHGAPRISWPGPVEAPLMQPSGCKPDAGAVPEKKLQSGEAPIGKSIGRAVARRAPRQGLHEQRQPIGAPAHVHGRDSQKDLPGGDHVSKALKSRAQPSASDNGQRTLTWTPWPVMVRLMVSCDACGCAASIRTGTKARGSDMPCVSLIQRCSKLALMPWVSAMPATDAPGCRAAATSWDLNSGECRRRRIGRSGVMMVSTKV